MATTEERLSALEEKVRELEQAKQNQDTINGAVLARIDSFIGDIHRLERDQRRGFEEMKSGQKNLEVRVGRVEEGLLALQAGQEQILAILTGKAKTND